MNLPNNIDKTTTSQKVIAGIFLVGIVLFLNWVAPILKNAVFSMCWIALLSIGYVFRNNFWNALKDLSYSLTKWQIKLNNITYLERCYAYMVEEKATADKALNRVSSVIRTEKDAIEAMKLSYTTHQRKAEQLLSQGDKDNAAIWAEKASTDEKLLQIKIPRYNTMKQNEKEMITISSDIGAALEKLGYKKDALIQQYNSSKALDEACGLMDQFLSGRSENAKMYKLAEQETIEATNLYISNYETFSRKMAPLAAGSNAEKVINQAEGLKLLEEWQKVGKLNLPEMAQ